MTSPKDMVALPCSAPAAVTPNPMAMPSPPNKSTDPRTAQGASMGKAEGRRTGVGEKGWYGAQTTGSTEHSGCTEPIAPCFTPVTGTEELFSFYNWIIDPKMTLRVSC